MAKKLLKETAAGGSTGGGAIAAAPGRLGGTRRRDTLKDFLVKWSSGVKNKMVMKPVFPTTTLKEFYDLNDVVSRLKSIEGSDQPKEDVVTYGVEDDEGNIMKVSVRKDQAKDFEYQLARDMADAKDEKISGANVNLSLAELLYNLKDKFNIVDVEFPTIPKDVIYNADKATYGPDTSETVEDDVISDDMGGGMEDDMVGMGDDTDEVSLDNGEVELTGDEGEEELDIDDESVEDFPEEQEAATPESLLQSVMDMLKADADAKKAQADAEAEKARAMQAEYAYKSSQATVAAQEEFAQMELEAEKQKQKEKEAKKLADVAKYRVRQTASPMGESTAPSLLFQLLNEIDDFDTIQSVNRDKLAARQKYKPAPNDSQEQMQYKQAMLQQTMRELDARLRAVKVKTKFNIAQSNKEKQEEADANNATRLQQNRVDRQ